MSGRGPVVVTGQPGVGKTTLLLRVAREELKGKCMGFVTEEGGCVAVTLDGQRAPLSRVGVGGPSRAPRVGKYRVDLASFEALALPLLAPPHKKGVVYVVDEVGKMELFSDAFVDAMRALLAAGVPLLCTAAQRGGGLIAELKGAPGAVVHTLTRASRDGAVAVVSAAAGRLLA